jgi:2-oxoglutarate ferredoxin oxidoreductase subunit alpha
MERLVKKFSTAAEIVPQPVLRLANQSTCYGVIYFGSTSPAMQEALDVLEQSKIALNAMRLRAFPFSKAVDDFILQHDYVFIVEQNRDAQMHTLIISELSINPNQLIKILHYDGTPITARFIVTAIQNQLEKISALSDQKNQELV